MAYKYWENSLKIVGANSPDEAYRELTQAFINEEWDNTSAKTPENGGKVLEQDEIGSADYKEIEVWISPVVGDTSSGLKQSLDFQKFIFRDIEHRTTVGLMYQFINNYWITYNDNPYDSLPKAILVRRCNNVLRIKDDENGGIFEIPCVVEYEMASPSDQVTKYIITPNNHAIVEVQGNADTMRLFRYNTRYVLNGRVFKLLAWQNAINNANTVNTPTLLRLDMYLDETQAQDDIEHGIAFNGEYNYEVVINGNDMTLVEGDTGRLTARVTLNGVEISDKEIEWSSSDDKSVKINGDGEYEVLKEKNTPVTITATLKGNTSAFSQIQITVGEQVSVTPSIIITPSFKEIRQYETISFAVNIENGGNIITPTATTLTMPLNKYCKITKTGVNSYDIVGTAISKDDINISISAENSDESVTATDTISIKAVSMLGGGFNV